jgi:hypothetical protein
MTALAVANFFVIGFFVFDCGSDSDVSDSRHTEGQYFSGAGPVLTLIGG